MKRKLAIVLSAEAIILLVLCIAKPIQGNLFAVIMAFPFEQIGLGLRCLSLSGTTGNFFSIIIYAIVCLLPGIYLAYRIYRRRAHTEDGLLALLSIVLFWVIYMMINPADIARHFGAFDIIDASKAFLGTAIYSIAAGYLILRMMRAFKDSSAKASLKYLVFLLAVICAVLIFGIFGSGLMELISAIKQLNAGNTGADQNLSLSYLFLVLQYLVKVLPFMLELYIIFAGFELIKAFSEDPYCKEVVEAARKVGHICRKSVAAIMISQISINALQLILGSSVRSSHYTLSIPLLSVVFVLIAMLMAGYFEHARQLKSDNEMFI